MARVKGSVLMRCEECEQEFCVTRLSLPAVHIWYVHECPKGKPWRISEQDVMLEALIRKTRNTLERLLTKKKTRRNKSFAKRACGLEPISTTDNTAVHDAPQNQPPGLLDREPEHLSHLDESPGPL
jgi:DNA-directed RNA polymerase beta' subunit